MWEPEPGWERLPGAGPATVGVWSATRDGQPVVVKRLARPDPDEPASRWQPSEAAYWRRAAEVALSGLLADTPGLVEPRVVAVQEDDEGVTLMHERVAPVAASTLFLADCLGRFAAAELGDQPWLARSQLRGRLRLVERRGGWRLLARTGAADVADHLWRCRDHWLDQLDAVAQVPVHGDATPGNLPGRRGPDAVAIDWSQLGTGPVGSDVGYLALSAREQHDTVVDAYVAALPAGTATADEVALGARVSAVYTALTRADWALARVAPGDGALAGKLRHPAVGPHLSRLQALLPQVEALLG